jgi:acid phosphatase type 7
MGRVKLNFKMIAPLFFNRNACLLALIVTLFIQGSVFSQTTLVPFGSSWKYKDDGSDQGTAWRQVGFDDSGWSSGPGKLGYGDPVSQVLNACGTPVPVPLCTNKYIGYYFRKTLNIPNVNTFQSFTFDMYRDDGVVVYVNGTEVFRDNMPVGTVAYNTLATAAAPDDGQSIVTVTVPLAASQLLSGNNVIAVEVHQSAPNSSDLTWDSQLIGIPIGLVLITRDPYLQKATSTSIIIRWNTNIAGDSKVTYGTDASNLTGSVVVPALVTNHSVTLTGLTPYTKYYYSVGTSSVVLQSGSENYFLTPPLPGTEGKYRFWVTGDVGNNSSNQRAVRDRYHSYVGSGVTNGWLLLGDNAYNSGTEAEYTTNFFDQYKAKMLLNTPLWPAPGNHDYDNGNNARRNDMLVPYFDMFDLPTNGEMGGVPSNIEAYYSFDYGNIHFVSLDSDGNVNGQTRIYDPTGNQMQWLIQDLTANTKPWVIVYFHHPPYTMGSHNF